MHEVMETVKPLAAEKPVLLEVEVPEPSVLVWADRDKVTQVLMNLIGNAIKFTRLKEGLWSPRRETATEWARVSVNDSGPGISAEECQKIFQKFYQVSEDGGPKPKGTGLVLLSPKRLWSCMAEEFGSSLSRVAAARSRSLCRYLVRKVLDCRELRESLRKHLLLPLTLS